MMRKISLILGVMMLMSLLTGVFLVEQASAATILVPNAHANIQHAINVSSNGDVIQVGDGTYNQNLVVNKSVTIQSENGSATTFIVGTINITVDNVQIGAETAGFTITQATIDRTDTHAINISTNASRAGIVVRDNIIYGGYDSIHIGGAGLSLTDNTTSNLTIYNNIIRNCGRSAIYAGPGQLRTANISVNRCHNTSNTIYGDIICIDGGHDVLIYYNTLYNSVTNGGMAINSTGATNILTNLRISKNTVYNVYPYSPICIVSQSDAVTVADVRITFNELENSSLFFTEPAIRFDNKSGLITATNISVFYNNINTTGNDIEEQSAGNTALFKNWSGVMKAYFNWYGSDAAGTFRNTGHQSASPRLHLGSASGDIWTYTDYLEGTQTAGTLNATANVDVLLELITSTADVEIVVYPYGLGGAYCPVTDDYPIRSMHNYKEIGVSDTSLITYPVNITIYYDAADLAIRGWSETHINGLTWYNQTSSEWEQFNDTGKNTSYAGQGYSGYVWGRAWTESQLTGAVLAINFNEITDDDGTTPAVDTDNDGYSDADEVAAGSDPNDPTSTPLDLDGDGYSNAAEALAGSDPNSALSTPATVAATAFLGVQWYWWIAGIAAAVVVIIAIYFAASPKAWKRFKKKF